MSVILSTYKSIVLLNVNKCLNWNIFRAKDISLNYIRALLYNHTHTHTHTHKFV